MLQIVNAGSATMWIRYGGNGINPGDTHDWKPFITAPSVLNNNVPIPFNAKPKGQGAAFRLLAGQYQIVPMAGSASWASATMGCDTKGENCIFAPLGRAGGTGPQDQANTLFEISVPGVWDGSCVDGYGPPIKIEVDGCGHPGAGLPSDCGGSAPTYFLSFTPDKCTNKIMSAQNEYLGCASMCGCQNAAVAQHVGTVPMCPGMPDITPLVGRPSTPGGLCGCPEGECVQALRNLFAKDPAGIAYCDSITEMTKGSDGKRPVYCQAYDDNHGTKSYGNGIIKISFCNYGFEWIPS